MARWAGSRITLFSQRILIAADCFALLCFALLCFAASLSNQNQNRFSFLISFFFCFVFNHLEKQ